jgi:integrase
MACISKRRGRWVIDFYDQHGKRRWKTLAEGATKGQAKEELRAIEDMLTKGVYLPHTKTPTFSEVARTWIEYKRPKLRESTWEVYEGHVRNHFQDLDGLKINRITVAVIEKFITARQLEGMNLGTLRKILVTLGQILNYAVRHKYLDHNPLRDAERPKAQGKEKTKEQQVLTPEQINTFLARVEDQKYYTLFIVAVMTGAREGEILGLKWSDIDWDNKQLQIQRTFNNSRFFLPKTKESRRKIDLPPLVLRELKKWRLACPKNEFDLIFPNKQGKPINHRNMVQRYFQPALKAAGLPVIRFHDLRHTYASLLIEQGENIKYIQSQLGHSSPTVTLNVYAHLMKPTNQEAVCRLENTVFGENGSKMVAGSEKGSRLKTVTP